APSATKVRGRDMTTRKNIGSLRNRTRRCSNSLSDMARPSLLAHDLIGKPASTFPDHALVLPLGDEARGGAQHVAAVAEDRQRGIAARQEVTDALLGAIDAELGDEGGFAERRVGAGRLAERGGIALDIEQIVGDLEGFAERAAVIVERLIFLLRGLAED